MLRYSFTHFHIFVSTPVELAFLLFLHREIRVHRPDIVDNENVRSVDSYDFIVVGGDS